MNMIKVRNTKSAAFYLPEYAVSSARLATTQDTIRETECPASYTYPDT